VVGVQALGDIILIYLRTRVLRIRNLPFADRPGFDIGSTEIDILAPNAGLAGSPKSHTVFESQRGHAVAAWVGDSGIWMSDGSKRDERGMGAVKLTQNLKWNQMVDTTRLDETILSFDPVTQLLYFDYYDRDGNARTLIGSTAPDHWIPLGDNQHPVPKWSGPHVLGRVVDRTIGELSDTLRQWSLRTDTLVLYNERTGTDDNGSDIISFLETGWVYAGGPRREFHVYTGALYHSDWGAGAVIDLELITRRDNTGIEQHKHKKGLSLRGERVTSFNHLSRAGQSLKVKLTHKGKTSSLVSPTRAIGPAVFDGHMMGEVEKD